MISDWSGRNVLVIGAARQGIALARYLVAKGARVVLNDQKPLDQLQDARQSLEDLPMMWHCGDHSLDLLEGMDLVCPSGGVPVSLPLVAEARRRGIPLSNDSQIFLENAPCPVIGITGSAGKTTTTSLVGCIAQESQNPSHQSESSTRYSRVWVGGNIGSPLISKLDRMQAGDLAVMELSSFQLEIMTHSPQIAVVLNITPNHLDRHVSMEAYIAAKARIITFQKTGNATVLGREDPIAWSLAGLAPVRVGSFGKKASKAMGEPATYLRGEQLVLRDGGLEKEIMPTSIIQLRGEHNLLNVLAACAASASAGLPVDAMRKAVEIFTGVPHRLEYVRTFGGADWYNDSIATAPERTIAAIRAFDEPIVLLVGGRDKNLPWDELAELVHRRVDHLVLFGEAAQKIQRTVAAHSPSGSQLTVELCSNLQQAVLAAARVIQPGDVVLLAPGGTSFDEFRDFEQRGEAFRKWVYELS